MALFDQSLTIQVNGDSTEDNDRKARAIWLQGSKHNPQCTGGVQTLLDGQKSTLASHSNYGQEVYPSDYQVCELTCLLISRKEPQILWLSDKNSRQTFE